MKQFINEISRMQKLAGIKNFSVLKEEETADTSGGIKKVPNGNDYSLRVSGDYWIPSAGKGQGEAVIAFKKGDSFHVNLGGSLWSDRGGIEEPQKQKLKDLLKQYVEDNNIQKDLKIGPDSLQFLGLSESQLNETKVGMWTTQEVLKGKNTSGKAPSESELRVNLAVAPNKFYGSMDELKGQIGKVTKIDGDTITVKDLKGKESTYDAADLIHVNNFFS